MPEAAHMIGLYLFLVVSYGFWRSITGRIDWTRVNMPVEQWRAGMALAAIFGLLFILIGWRT